MALLNIPPGGKKPQQPYVAKNMLDYTQRQKAYADSLNVYNQGMANYQKAIQLYGKPNFIESFAENVHDDYVGNIAKAASGQAKFISEPEMIKSRAKSNMLPIKTASFNWQMKGVLPDRPEVDLFKMPTTKVLPPAQPKRQALNLITMPPLSSTVQTNINVPDQSLLSKPKKSVSNDWEIKYYEGVS